MKEWALQNRFTTLDTNAQGLKHSNSLWAGSADKLNFHLSGCMLCTGFQVIFRSFSWC